MFDVEALFAFQLRLRGAKLHGKNGFDSVASASDAPANSAKVVSSFEALSEQTRQLRVAFCVVP